jgi:polyhydroxybutyrate depolymerase
VAEQTGVAMSTTSHTIEVGPVTRRYLVHPPRVRPDAAMPVVILLHGAGGTAKWTLEETGFASTSNREGILLVLPEGTRADPDRPPGFLDNPQVWNDKSGHGMAGPRHADDVGFIRALLDRVEAEFPVDPRQIYVTGFSNGACMTFCLATELSERIAAVAPVAGHLRLSDPRPAVARPTLFLIGAADPLVPLEGGTIRSPWDGREFRRPAVADTLRRWALALGCGPEPTKGRTEIGVQITEYGPCRDGASLTAYVIDGLGHHWPGGRGRLNRRFAGPPSDRVRANDVIWDFFRRHPQP